MDAARRYFADAAQRHGTIDGQTVRIPMTQADLARRTGHSASTVSAHLRSLGDNVLQRSPEIVITMPDAPPASDLGIPADNWVITIRLEVTIAGGHVVRIATDGQPVPEPARPATKARDGRGEIRGLRLVEEPKEVGEDLLSSSSPPHQREAIRDESATTATGEESLDNSQLDELLAPLHEATRRAHLRPMTSRAPLYEALRPYRADQVRQAVSQLVHEVNTLTTDIRSPFGVLVVRARQGLPDATPSRPPIPSGHVVGPFPEPAAHEPGEYTRGRLDALSNEELADLDAHVQAQEGGSIRMPPEMQRAMRLEYLEAWLRSRGQNEDRTRTPREDR